MTDDPNEALAAVRASRQAVQRRVAAGSWRYDLTYSAIVAAMIGAQVLDMPLSTLAVALGVLALALLFRRESERLGVSVTGMSPRHARKVAIGLGLLLVPLMLAAIVLNARVEDPRLLALGAGALMLVAFGLSLAGSRLWLRVYRRETGVGE